MLFLKLAFNSLIYHTVGMFFLVNTRLHAAGSYFSRRHRCVVCFRLFCQMLEFFCRRSSVLIIMGIRDLIYLVGLCFTFAAISQRFAVEFWSHRDVFLDMFTLGN